MATDAGENNKARQRAHDRLDQFIDIALREQLWGDVEIRVTIRNQKIEVVRISPDLSEKF